MGRSVVDSNIVIDDLLGHAPAIAELERRPDAAISIVTWIEVMSGGPADQEDQVRRFLKRFELLPLSAGVAAETALIRRFRRLKLPDAVIWATARVASLPLVTRNTKVFQATDEGVIVPYVL